MSTPAAYRSGPHASAAPPYRRLWQVPVFLVGLAAALLVWWHRPLLPSSPAELAAQRLQAALAALDAGDYEQAQTLAREVLDHGLSASDLVGDARFVLGSALLLQADTAKPEPGNEAYARARVYLQQARQLGVSSKFELPLAYRLLCAEFHTGGDPATLAANLERLLEREGIDRVSGYELLTTLWLRKQPPDREAALRANDKLLAQPYLNDPNPARLQRGELLCRLKRKAEARAILARVPSGAAEYPRARHMRAQCAFDDEQWPEAMSLWEEAVRQGGDDDPAARPAALFLGLCYARLGRTQDAITTWQRLEEHHPQTAEAAAAGFHRAEAHLSAGQDAQALASFRAALQAMSGRAANVHLDASAMQRMVEEAWTRWFGAGRFDFALQLLQDGVALFPTAEVNQRLAQTCRAAAQDALRRAERGRLGADDELLEKARTLFAQAGEALDRAAQECHGQPDFADTLCSAAECFLQAEDYARVVVALERCLGEPLAPARRLDVLVDLAEAHLALGHVAESSKAHAHTEQAAKLLTETLAKQGRTNSRTLYLWAMTECAQGRYSEAEATLRQLFTLPISDPEPVEVRHAFFAFGYVLQKQKRYAEAITVLEESLERYPTHTQALNARVCLADSLRQAAEVEAVHLNAADTNAARAFYDEQKRAYLEKAITNYQAVVAELSARGARRPLSKAQHLQLRDSAFSAGWCLCSLGRYGEAAGVYTKLGESYPQHPDGAMAFLQLAQCYLNLGKAELARTALERCRAVVRRLSPEDFRMSQHSRAEWDEWIDTVARSCRTGP